jgi:very long chain acyl-CoA dehydrogenase
MPEYILSYDSLSNFSTFSEEQFKVTLLANAAIDIYSMAAVLSRCTAASAAVQTTANHEQHIANLFCDQVPIDFEQNTI